MKYVDLLFCHRPDPETPIEETVWAMHDIISSGKALYWGTSEWSAEQIREAWDIADKRNLRKPQMEQPQYSLLVRTKVEKEFARLYEGIGLGLTTFSPLYYGILSGKYNDGIPQGSRASMDDYSWIKERITPQRIEIVRQLTLVANDLGITPAQLAIAWVLRRKEVSSVITGATRLEQLDENLGASEAYEQFTELDIDRIFACLGNYQE
mgnify:CR=1 FL=1